MALRVKIISVVSLDDRVTLLPNMTKPSSETDSDQVNTIHIEFTMKPGRLEMRVLCNE